MASIIPEIIRNLPYNDYSSGRTLQTHSWSGISNVYGMTCDLRRAEYFTGRSIPAILKAVHIGELHREPEGHFFMTDLAAWTEELRFRECPYDPVGSKYQFCRDGVMVFRNALSEQGYQQFYDACVDVVAQEETYEKNHYYVYAPGQDEKLRLERIRRIFDIAPETGRIFGHPVLVHLSCELYMGKPFVPFDIRLKVDPPFGIDAPEHRDFSWVCHDHRRDARLWFGIPLNRSEEHGGCELQYLPGTHRIKNGRAVPIGTPQDQFKGFPLYPGDISVHNVGTLHYAPVNRTETTRMIAYVGYLTVEEYEAWGRAVEHPTYLADIEHLKGVYADAINNPLV